MAVHFILQPKGGVGKSYVASILAQYLLDKGINVEGFDLDPSNPTFSEYATLPVSRFNLLEDKKGLGQDQVRQIDNNKFNAFTEAIQNAEADTELIVDCGSSAFIPVINYLKRFRIEEWFASLNHPVVVHSLIKGGGEMIETLEATDTLLKQFPESPFVLWLNEYQFPVTIQNKSFIETPIYKAHSKRIIDAIPLPQYTSGFLSGDLDKMIEARLTLKEALEKGAFNILSQRALFLYKKDLWERLDLFYKNYLSYLKGGSK